MTVDESRVVCFEEREHSRVLTHPCREGVLVDGYGVAVRDRATRRKDGAAYLDAEVRGEDRKGVVEIRIFGHFFLENLKRA